MKVPFLPTEKGVFVRRLNRFVAESEIDGSIYRAHVATSGRLGELLLPGALLLLEKSGSQSRRTPYSIRAVDHNGVWVSIDAHIPNKLVAKALQSGSLPPFAGCSYVRREPAYDAGRFDFLLQEVGQPVYVEVKSVTLVENRVGLFPDAPTLRGRRHLDHLAALAANGCRAAVIFVLQRHDADSFAPNGRTDPAFAAALHRAALSGVEIYAYRCYVEPSGITLGERLPVMGNE